jgi:4-hydroxy-2-oxoheptanedioate aldolase
MNPTGFRQALATGGPTIGSWLTLASGVAAEMSARQGFDWLLVDTQHGEVTWDSLGGIIQAVELGGAQAIVRVGWNDPRLVMRAFDLGAAGVVVPMISTEADAQIAAAASRYPPQGNRSFGRVRGFYAATAAENPVCILMIETEEGLANVEAIASVPGVDALFVGIVDLALSLGLPKSSHTHPRILQAIERVITACDRAGLVVGAPSMNVGHATSLLESGMRFVTLGGDLPYLMRGGREDAERAAQLKAVSRKTAALARPSEEKLK